MSDCNEVMQANKMPSSGQDVDITVNVVMYVI